MKSAKLRGDWLQVPFALTALIVLCSLQAGGPAFAAGFLWLSGYDWSGDPTPIYRYDISANLVDLVVETGIQDQMINNLAVTDSTLYIGAGHGREFWKADVYTGEVFEQGVYEPEIPGLLMDGAHRTSNGHLYRADALGRLFETDTHGQIIMVHDVTNGAGLTGLEFVGDELYGTCDAGFGSIDSEPDWTFHSIPLSGVDTGPGSFLGGLAYDQDEEVLFLAVFRDGATKLYSVQPDQGSATLISDLTAEAEYPPGVWPQAMGWVGEITTGLEQESWGSYKSLFR